jgi:hypothetical protein
MTLMPNQQVADRSGHQPYPWRKGCFVPIIRATGSAPRRRSAALVGTAKRYQPRTSKHPTGQQGRWLETALLPLPTRNRLPW